MSVKRNMIASLAALVIAGGAAAAGAQAASAATTACGSTCMTLFNSDFGRADVMTVSGTNASVRAAVNLSPGSRTQTQDWRISSQDQVPDLYKQGLVTAKMAALYGQDEAYEFQYEPDGILTGLCLGLPAAARQHEQVRLEPCGVNADTIWIYDRADPKGRFAPLIPGSDSSASPLLVLTGGKVGNALTVEPVSVKSGVIATDQMWQSANGVLP